MPKGSVVIGIPIDLLVRYWPFFWLIPSWPPEWQGRLFVISDKQEHIWRLEKSMTETFWHQTRLFVKLFATLEEYPFGIPLCGYLGSSQMETAFWETFVTLDKIVHFLILLYGFPNVPFDLMKTWHYPFQWGYSWVYSKTPKMGQRSKGLKVGKTLTLTSGLVWPQRPQISHKEGERALLQ